MKMSMEGGSMTMSGQRCALPLGDVSGEDLDLVYYYTIFPNLFLSLHPDYVLIHRAEPRGVGQTRIICEWLFHPDTLADPHNNLRDAVEFWDLTNRQDWDIVEQSQLGISSRVYQPGPYSARESIPAAWDREYLRWMGH